MCRRVQIVSDELFMQADREANGQRKKGTVPVFLPLQRLRKAVSHGGRKRPLPCGARLNEDTAGRG
jgi:hypothetical protein